MEPYSEFLPAVQRFHDTGVESYVFGIGHRISIDELSLIASSPSNSHVFLVDSLTTLQLQHFVRESVLQVMCSSSTETTPVPPTQPQTTQAATTTQADTPRPQTTQADTTQATTTQAATTQAETTQATTTQADTTQADITQADTTQAATTQVDTTQAATTQADTTQRPTTPGTSGLPVFSLSCPRRMSDVVLALESTATVGGDGWAAVIQLAQTIIVNSNIDSRDTRVATIIYSDTAALLFDFRSSITSAVAASQITRLPFSAQSGSKPSAALDLIADQVLATPNLHGYRGGAVSVLLVTGPTHDDLSSTVIAAAARVKALGAEVFAVSVGASTTEQVEAIASEPLATHAASIDTYAGLQDTSFLSDFLLRNLFCYANSPTGTTRAPPSVTATPTPTISFTTPVESTTPAIIVSTSTGAPTTTTEAPPTTSTAAPSTTATTAGSTTTTVVPTTTTSEVTPALNSTDSPIPVTVATADPGVFTDSPVPVTDISNDSQTLLCINGVVNSTGDACTCSDTLCAACTLTSNTTNSASSSTCVSCFGNLYLLQGSCVGQCPVGWQPDHLAQYGGARTCNALCTFQDRDVIFLIDSSSSIGTQSYGLTLQLVSEILGQLPIDNGGPSARVSLVNFASDPEIEFLFKDVGSNHDLQQKVVQSAYQGGPTSVAKALSVAQKILTNAFTGARGGLSTVVLLSDGQSAAESNAIGVADALKDAGVEIFTVSTGFDVEKSGLALIASTPTASHSLILKSTTLSTTVLSLTKALGCGELPTTEVPSHNCVNGVSDVSGQPCDCGTGCTTCAFTGNHRHCLGVTECPLVPYDLIFLLDASADMGQINFHFSVDFIGNVLGALPLGAADVHVALVEYAEESAINFNFKESYDADQLINLAYAAQFQGGPSKLTQALDSVRSNLLWSSSSGYRNIATKLVILSSAGACASAINAAAALREELVDIFVVTMNSNNASELSGVASSYAHLFLVTDVDMLHDASFAGVFVNAINCEAGSSPDTESPLQSTYTTNKPAPTTLDTHPGGDDSGSGSGSGSDSGDQPDLPDSTTTVTESTTIESSSTDSTSTDSTSTIVERAQSEQNIAGGESLSYTSSSSSSSSSGGSGSSTTLIAVVSVSGGLALVAVIAIVAMKINASSNENTTQFTQIPALPARRNVLKKKTSDLDLGPGTQPQPQASGLSEAVPAVALAEGVTRRHL